MKNLLRTCGCSLLVSACLALSAAAFNLDSLLIKSIGGPAALDTVRAMTSFRVAGTVRLNGQPGTFLEIVVPPDKLYLEVSLPQFTIVQAFDGSNAWQRDLNGRVAPLSGFEREELIRSVYFESYAFLIPERFPGERSYVGDTIVTGNRYHKIRFVPNGTDTVTVLFDVQTGLRFAVLSALDNIGTVTTSGDYRLVSGVLIPFKSRSTATGAPLEVEFSADSAAFNVAVDTTIFVRPDSRVQDFYFPSTEELVEIPFKYIQGHIYIEGNINGHKRARFILDSGASAALFHEGTIKYLNLPVVGTMPARGVSGFEEVKLVKTDSLTIGPLALYNQIGGSIDLSILGNPGAEGMALGGVLGYDFLSRFPMMVDYQRQVLTVFNPQSYLPPGGGYVIPFDLTMQVPTITVTVAGDSGRFIVDLGNAFDLILHEEFAASGGLLSRLKRENSQARGMGGIGGGLTGQTAIAPEVKMGDLILTDVPVTLPNATLGISGSKEVAGNIGNELLKRFRVLFDYHQHRMTLYPVE